MSGESAENDDIRGVGMKYDGGKPRVDLVLSGFPRALLAVAEVATFGAAKYAEDSWADVPDGVKRYTAAKDRHRLIGAVELTDAETNLRHAAHEAWNALAVLELQLRAMPPEISGVIALPIRGEVIAR